MTILFLSNYIKNLQPLRFVLTWFMTAIKWYKAKPRKLKTPFLECDQRLDNTYKFPVLSSSKNSYLRDTIL